MQCKLESAVRTGASRSSKQAPTWHSSPATPKSLSGQFLDQPIHRLTRKVFWGSGTAISCTVCMIWVGVLVSWCVCIAHTPTHKKILAFQMKQAKKTMPKLFEDCQVKDSERTKYRYDVTGKILRFTNYELKLNIPIYHYKSLVTLTPTWMLKTLAEILLQYYITWWIY